MNANNISLIDDWYFANFSSLKTLVFSNNRIRAITRLKLKGLEVLKTLDLSVNLITEIDCDVFYDCVSLVRLSIGENGLTSLPCVNFSSTSHSLKALDLKFNHISRVFDTDRSQLLSRLTHLDMTGNGLLSLQYIISEMPSLETLAVGENPNLKFRDDDFLNLPKLASIILSGKSGNGITEVPYLGPARSIITNFDLTYNSIDCIDIHHISNMTSLVNLSASYNNLWHFPNMGCSPNSAASNMSDIKFPALQSVKLDYNQLVEFPLLPQMPLGSSISIRSNKLRLFPPERMAMLDKVRYLYMPYNEATIFPNFSLLVESNLVSLYISNCKINSIPEAHIDKLSKLQYLDISHNRIAELPTMGFARQSLVWLHMDYNLIEALDPMLLAGTQTWRLEWLYAQHNNISSIPQSLWRQMNHVELLYLQHNRLDEMPDLAAVGATLRDVDLSQNRIPVVPHGHLVGLHGLETFNLSYNNIVDFSFWISTALERLTALELEHNEINSLKYLNSPPIKDKFTLNIMNNPIVCSGEICWLRNFNRSTIKREDKLCRNQPELADLVFDDIEDSVLGCSCRSHSIPYFLAKSTATITIYELLAYYICEMIHEICIQ